ncbi:hypothetical protein EHEL_101485 [Encephalitozoon hellem ATCC 50504]|uniref:Uncharacterized protein n=1 Tax=Encephalitozoon hellem TaxID=27973 RepID=A0A9Q9F952_ENCHE|nr:uncharacterized protein EHEL_101485 [Encephalitozoon hellem ATCC 50504]AHL28974.1 hypothetical protein EHEL_101485 [Encephalitozoon hellem ATCC 50504]UTX44228.1 hypothetical protein GPU96_10g20200 [Encephalitozoon hellem]WEL39719.1 hypothetical protein PFJ87_10g01680 [Encephalitozoon hellem]
MCDNAKKIRGIAENVNILLKKAEKRRKSIIDEIRAVDEYLKELEQKKKRRGRRDQDV